MTKAARTAYSAAGPGASPQSLREWDTWTHVPGAQEQRCGCAPRARVSPEGARVHWEVAVLTGKGFLGEGTRSGVWEEE